MNYIEQIIYEKLTKNTGTHFLDSGGTNNRNWQRNQNKTLQDFINEPEQTFEIEFDKENKANEIIRTVSVFHFLAGSGSQLELDSICNQFNAYNELDEEYEDCEAYGVKISAWDYLQDYDINIQRTWNTYNYESDLSQVLQGTNLEINEEQYILIQIHGGADVRGGYTNALLFKCPEGIINEYLYEHMDSYDLDNELEYIDIAYDYFDNTKIFTGQTLETIKEQLINK